MTRIDVEPIPDLEREPMPEYLEALRLAGIIARWEGVETDDTMIQALYVATIIRLQSEGRDDTSGGPLEAGNFVKQESHYTHPREVCDVLTIRLRHPEQYARLPKVEIERRFRGDA